VVHTTAVSDAVLTGQSKPSMVILFSVATAEKPLPAKVTSVPPVTGPNLGLIEVSLGVNAPV